MKKRLFCDATYHQFYNANPLNNLKTKRREETPTTGKIGFKYRMER